jgi:hypothetical protein
MVREGLCAKELIQCDRGLCWSGARTVAVIGIDTKPLRDGAETVTSVRKSPAAMAERGDNQRQLAAMEQHQAFQQRVKARDAVTDEEREQHRRSAWSSEQAALLRDYLADLYDRQDTEGASGGMRSFDGAPFRDS